MEVLWHQLCFHEPHFCFTVLSQVLLKDELEGNIFSSLCITTFSFSLVHCVVFKANPLFSFSGRRDWVDPTAVHERPCWLWQLGYKIFWPHHDRDGARRQWLCPQSQQSESHLRSRPHLWVWEYLHCQSWKPHRLWDQTGEQPRREEWRDYQASECLLPYYLKCI